VLRAEGLGFRVLGAGLKIQSKGLSGSGFGFKVYGQGG